MALTWKLTSITDYESVCWLPEYEGSTYKTLNPVTEYLIFSTMSVGMGEITEANWEEFYAREVLQWHVYGGLKVTPEQVRQHIGLKTNASPITKAAFNASVIKHLRRDAAVAVSKLTDADVTA